MTGVHAIVVLIGGVLLGGFAAGAIRHWLNTRGYRYPEEENLPLTSLTWFVPVTALLVAGVLLAWWGRDRSFAVAAAAAVLPLMAMSAIDVDTHRLPDLLTYPFAVYAILLAGIEAIQNGAGTLSRAILSGLALGAAYLILVLIGGGNGMGLGDAKLAVGLGILLGIVGVPQVFAATLLAFVIAGFRAVWLIAHGASRKATIAFGPYMVAGAVLVLIAPLASVLKEITT